MIQDILEITHSLNLMYEDQYLFPVVVNNENALSYSNVRSINILLNKQLVKSLYNSFKNNILDNTLDYSVIELCRVLRELTHFLYSYETDYVIWLHDSVYDIQNNLGSIQIIMGLSPEGMNLSFFSQIASFYDSISKLNLKIESNYILNSRWEFSKEIYLGIIGLGICCGSSSQSYPFFGWSR